MTTLFYKLILILYCFYTSVLQLLMKKTIHEDSILQNVDGKLYIVRKKVFLKSPLIKPIEYDKTIAICTELMDAMKIKETDKNIYIITEYK